MKFNWGTGIAIVLVLFAISMGYAVYTAVQQKYDLVTLDYYGEELVYQDKIDQKNNALRLGGEVKLTATEKGLVIGFPEKLRDRKVTATINMYCVTDAGKDFTFTEDNWKVTDISIPAYKIDRGKWTAKITIDDGSTSYYFDPQIVIP